MEWYYVYWPWLTYKRIAQVCQRLLSFMYSHAPVHELSVDFELIKIFWLIDWLIFSGKVSRLPVSLWMRIIYLPCRRCCASRTNRASICGVYVSNGKRDWQQHWRLLGWSAAGLCHSHTTHWPKALGLYRVNLRRVYSTCLDSLSQFDVVDTEL